MRYVSMMDPFESEFTTGLRATVQHGISRSLPTHHDFHTFPVLSELQPRGESTRTYWTCAHDSGGKDLCTQGWPAKQLPSIAERFKRDGSAGFVSEVGLADQTPGVPRTEVIYPIGQASIDTSWRPPPYGDVLTSVCNQPCPGRTYICSHPYLPPATGCSIDCHVRSYESNLSYPDI